LKTSLQSSKEGNHLVCAQLGGHGGYFTNQNSSEVVSAIEKLTAQKQDTNHPIQDNKPWQPVATDRNPLIHPLKKGPI
jgi:hypothetical protein